MDDTQIGNESRGEERVRASRYAASQANTIAQLRAEIARLEAGPTLRDQFAMAVIQGVYASNADRISMDRPDDYTKASYAIAGAMLSERKALTEATDPQEGE